MQAFVVFAAVIAAASAGGITGYSTGNYVQHAHSVQAVAAGVAPVGLGYGAVGVAPVVAKAVGPAAVSNQFVNRAPAARVLAGVAPVGIAPVGVGYAAPALAGPVGYAGLAGPVGPVGYGVGPALLG